MTKHRATIEATAFLKGFLPRSTGYRECADLNGAEARRFLEANGFVVVENGDTGRYGFARTECGIVLSSNGYAHRDRR